MTLFIQANSASTRNLNSTDELYVPHTVDLITGSGYGIRSINTGSVRVSVDGTVVALSGHGIFFEGGLGGNSVQIGEAATVRGGQSGGYFGVAMEGANDRLSNLGSIISDSGVLILNSSDAEMSNFGTIHATAGHAVTVTASTYTRVANAGDIWGHEGFKISDSDVRLVNTGAIFAFTTGLRLQGTGSLEFKNSGSITADDAINTTSETFAVFIFNSGEIVGNVILNGADDLYDGRGGQLVGTLFAGGGADVLRGGRDDDVFHGESGDDRLFGRRGDDILIGGEGQDRMRGGRDDDTFVFESINDSAIGSSADVILGFTRGDDQIDLSVFTGISFFRQGGFSGQGPEVKAINKGYGTLLRVDADGDGSVDMDIRIMGTKGITDADFIL